MGCDIHLFTEQRINGEWKSLDKYSKNEHYEKGNEFGEPEFEIKREDKFYTGGRNYNLFCALAGARSFEFCGDPKIVAAPRGIPLDSCKEIKQEAEKYGSDGHTNSFLYRYDLENFDWRGYGETCNDFLLEVIPKLIATGASEDDVRIVFFFDN